VHVLAVEPDAELARALAEELSGAGMRVTAAGSAAEADAAMRAEWPDLVLVDLAVSDCDGLVLVARLRARNAPPIVVLSRTRRRADPVLAFRLGAEDVVHFPYVPGEIAARVQALLRWRKVDATPRRRVMARAG
jgi:DNA-binding response OmpR family regulator